LASLEKQFGKDVALLVNGVTKLGRIPYSSREEQQAENLAKCCSRWRRTSGSSSSSWPTGCTTRAPFSIERRKAALQGARDDEIYAPIADRLGIRRIKEELEDISLRYLDPIAYAEIESQLAEREARQQFLANIKQRIYDRVKVEHPNAYIEGRVKSVYGIYRKVYVQGRSFDEVFDIYAVRIIVDSVIECYNI
jgi:GTP pyrophosphokinase